ncbi:MAG: (2Fe-2S)-binding protein [Deltaproteobacteria bacterium]|nr:(2Fe-2S)-binding protein [Deltaproteobacteria bacterium]
MLSLTIDEREVDVKEGATILEAAEAAGVWSNHFRGGRGCRCLCPYILLP